MLGQEMLSRALLRLDSISWCAACSSSIISFLRAFWDDHSVPAKDEPILHHQLVPEMEIWGYDCE